ncbi:hypothetical protein ET495_06845 [Xylanimonas allomyrinae]|uniref:Uncharacterized protein n=1 Tax=Xylanimonas allomyrinae TaxID=2509459 RepID=A0A4P6EKR6_9MICO|nr:hypothetical protein [Xylanimonas allomyrinae]QAY63005.1 hypothetical protein ET495_06845 [Xylanimonas allomyrinae]
MRATRHAFGEAGRNTLAAPFLYGALLIAVALVTAAAAFADLTAIARVVAAERAFLDAGGEIVRATHTDGRIDARACAAIADIEGVTAASAVTTHQARLAGRPGHPQNVMTATPGLEDVIDAPTLQPGQILTSVRALDRWSWQTGTQIQLLPAHHGMASELWEPPAELLTTAGTANLGRLGDGADSTLIIPAAPSAPPTNASCARSPQRWILSPPSCPHSSARPNPQTSPSNARSPSASSAPTPPASSPAVPPATPASPPEPPPGSCSPSSPGPDGSDQPSTPPSACPGPQA